MHQRVSQKRRRGPLLARLRAWPQYAARLITVVAPSQYFSKGYVDGLAARFFDAAFKAGCTANTISFKMMMRRLRGHHKGKDFSTLTLLAIFGTDNPSTINAIPREEFLARVNAKKQDLDLPLTHIKSGGRGNNQYPKDKLMGLTTGQAVGAVKHALRQCNATGFTGGSMDAATYHSAFVPHFMAHLGLTDVNKVPAKSTLYDVYQAHKRKATDVAVEPASAARSRKRARRAPKQMEG